MISNGLRFLTCSHRPAISRRWWNYSGSQSQLRPEKSLKICYNNAEIAVERNFTGYAVLSHMDDYGNIYRQRDFITGKVTTQKGWWTNEQTKEFMRTVLKDKLPFLKIWDVNLNRQLRGYRYIKMRPTAQTFDDMAIALMIACAVKKVVGTARGYIGATQGWSW